METSPVELVWRALDAADLTALSALMLAVEQADAPRERHSLDQLEEDLTTVGADPARDTRVGCAPDGTLVAYGWNHPQHADVSLRRVLITGAVHPDWRGRGIGRQLMDWHLDAARMWDGQTRESHFGPLRVLARPDEHLRGMRRLYERFGLEASRFFANMTLPLAGRSEGPVEVPGVEIVVITPELRDPARLAINEAFLDAWAMQPVGAERWAEELASSTCQADWSLVALERSTGEVIGCAINATYVAEWGPQGYTEGQTDRLGVLRGWRKRGIASALLRRSMEIFDEAGLEHAGLGVDAASPTGAFGLYEELGYRVTSQFVIHTRTEPGAPG